MTAELYGHPVETQPNHAPQLAREAQEIHTARQEGRTVALIALPIVVRGANFEEREMLGLPDDSLAQDLHITLDGVAYTLREMEPRQRARYAAGLIMQDWHTLATQVGRGARSGVDMFAGVSPMARPHTLRRLGAVVTPGTLSADDLRTLSLEYQRLNGCVPVPRQISRFVIGRDAMAASAPTAGRIASILLGELHGE